jgi:uncharacterized membrane protein
VVLVRPVLTLPFVGLAAASQLGLGVTALRAPSTPVAALSTAMADGSGHGYSDGSPVGGYGGSL